MKVKPLMTLRLLGVITLLLMAMSLLASPLPQRQKSQPQQQKGAPIYIPDEVKSVMLQGLPSRQPRLDIPFSITQNLFLPARDGLHSIFFLKIKNADLGFIPVAQGEPAKKQEGTAEQAQVQPASGQMLHASFNIFLMFNIMEGDQNKIYREIYVPCHLQLDPASVDLEKEDYYTLGIPLPKGHYVLALAITSLDLKKIGLQYYEFELPDPATFTEKMETTPIFFVKELERIDSPEMRVTLHKDYFTYSVLKILPNIERSFAVGENLDIFFFIFGAQPNAEQKYDLELNYEVKKDDEVAIRWVPQNYDAPLISQPLPLKQTVIVKQGEEQRQETRDLPEGKYTLNIQIQDKVSGKTLTKLIDFEVK